jgi:hypothetical protein
LVLLSRTATLGRKDELVAELTRSRLVEIEKQEQVLEQLPALRKDLMETFQALEARLSVLDLFQPGTPLRGLLTQLETLAQEAGPSQTFDTEGTATLPSHPRRNVRTLTASLSSDKAEMVLAIPEVVVHRTEIRVAPENEVRAIFLSSSALLIKRRDERACQCLEVDVQLVEHG